MSSRTQAELRPLALDIRRAHEDFPAPNDAAFEWLRKPLCAFCLAFADMLVVVMALQIAVLIRSSVLPSVFGQLPQTSFVFGHYLNHWWIWSFFPVVFALQGLYTKRSTLWTEMFDVLRAVCLASLSVLAIVTLGAYAATVSRLTLLLTGCLLVFLMPVGRIVSKRILFAFDLWKKRVLVLGAARTGNLAMRALTEDPVLGYSVVGFLDDDPGTWGQSIDGGKRGKAKVVGPISYAKSLLARGAAQDVVIAMPSLDEKRLTQLVHELQGCCETIRVVPRFWGLPMMSLQLDYFLEARFFTLNITNNLGKPWNRWIKRWFDLVFASLLSIIALPVVVVSTVLVTLDSQGHPLFVQMRLGRRGSKFRCFKLRTMHVNADQRFEDYLKKNPEQRAEWNKYAKLRARDPRLTKIGRLLRRWSLDELPQLWNVIRGDMSVVGPRPYLPRELERIGPDVQIILQTQPGLTGLWQVSGRNDLTFEERVSLESWYNRNWSLWLDLIILAKTVKAVVSRRGSHA